MFLHAPLLACLSVCPFFVVVAGLWGNPVLNSPYIHVGECVACNPPGAKRVTEFIIKKCQTGHMACHM